MQINWKVRLKSKTFWVGICGVMLAFVFRMLSELGISCAVTEGMISDLITVVLTILGALGVVVDPTTQGVNDSNRAMNYNQPYKG